MKMEWTREKTLCLINEYKQRRGLWDMTHDDYRKKEVKQKLLAEVSASLGGDIPIPEIEKKFHTLRTQYHREINRMKRKEPYNSKWFGFKNLQYLSSPKACRTPKGKIRTVITEDGTLATKIEVVHPNDFKCSSPNSSTHEEFLTLHHNTASSRTEEFEKLIEETTKDDEDPIEIKPKMFTKVSQYRAHIEVNPDMNLSETEIEEHIQPLEEGIETVEVTTENEGNVIYHHENNTVNTSTERSTPHIKPTSRIIKIQKREAFPDETYYGESPPKRIFYSSEPHTANVVVNPTTASSQSTTTTGNYITSITKLSSQKQQQQQRPSTIQSTINGTAIKRDQPTLRDQFSCFGEHIANEMRGITRKEILISLKHKINTAVFEAQMDELRNK